jgi:hypothetical protein
MYKILTVCLAALTLAGCKVEERDYTKPYSTCTEYGPEYETGFRSRYTTKDCIKNELVCIKPLTLTQADGKFICQLIE